MLAKQDKTSALFVTDRLAKAFKAKSFSNSKNFRLEWTPKWPKSMTLISHEIAHHALSTAHPRPETTL